MHLVRFRLYKLQFSRPPHDLPGDEISFSFEVCSETIYYNNHWPSDITVSVNDVEVATFTSPGDFGGRRGPVHARTLAGYVHAVRHSQKNHRYEKRRVRR